MDSQTTYLWTVGPRPSFRSAPSVWLILLLLAACAVPREPRSPVRVERDWGFAAGADQAEAERLAGVIEQVLPIYRELEGFYERPLRAHVAEDLGYEHLAGISAESTLAKPWVAVRRSASAFEFTIAHELAHFYFRGVHAKLPTIVEEGLCEHLAARVFGPSDRYQQRLIFAAASYLEDFDIKIRGPAAKAGLAYLVQPVPTIEELFEVGWQESLGARPRTAATLYGLGWMIAEHIGYEGILDLIRRSDAAGHERVPSAWLREAAGLMPASQEALIRAFGRALQGREPKPGDVLTVTLGDMGEG